MCKVSTGKVRYDVNKYLVSATATFLFRAEGVVGVGGSCSFSKAVVVDLQEYIVKEVDERKKIGVAYTLSPVTLPPGFDLGKVMSLVTPLYRKRGHTLLEFNHGFDLGLQPWSGLRGYVLRG